VPLLPRAIGASEEERRVVEMRFSDSKGFNYLQFAGSGDVPTEGEGQPEEGAR